MASSFVPEGRLYFFMRASAERASGARPGVACSDIGPSRAAYSARMPALPPPKGSQSASQQPARGKIHFEQAAVPSRVSGVSEKRARGAPHWKRRHARPARCGVARTSARRRRPWARAPPRTSAACPPPLPSRRSRGLGKRRLGRDADAREPFDDVAEDHEEARLRHREHLAAFHHAAARPGSPRASPSPRLRPPLPPRARARAARHKPHRSTRSARFRIRRRRRRRRHPHRSPHHRRRFTALRRPILPGDARVRAPGGGGRGGNGDVGGHVAPPPRTRERRVRLPPGGAVGRAR